MRWCEPVKIDESSDKELKSHDPVLRQLLFARGIRDDESAEQFLNPKLDDLEDPLSLYDVEAAAARIEQAIEKGKRIFIHGDFDADGVSATALLWEYLFRDRGAKALPYIPSRVDEGYGMSEKSVSALIKKGSDLIISVDCGIRDVEIIRKFRRSKKNPDGVDFVVTDHHQPGDKLPRYVPIVHPMHPKGNYSNPYLSGAAVAWKLIAAMEKIRDPKGFAWEKIKGLDLVAFSTICDLVPLSGENRILAKYGLDQMRKGERLGLKRMADEAGITVKSLEAYHIGFILGPRVNAAGRMGDAMDAVRLFSTEKDVSARAMADKLGRLNRERQELTDEILAQVRVEIERDGTGNHLYFASGNDWPEGIVGLVAGKLQEKFYRPVIVVSEGEKISRGSARSISGFNVIEAIEKFKGLLVKHGGHSQAAGFTLETSKIPTFKQKMQDYAKRKLEEEHLIREICPDAIADVSEMTWDLHGQLSKMAPFGYGNRRPVFWLKNATIVDSRRVGDDKHLKMMVTGDGGAPLSCIFFNGGDWLTQLVKGDVIDLVGTLDTNEWNGEVSLQFKVDDLRKE